jgi:hypothetical protein
VKALLGVGLIALILGVLSLFVPIPQSHRQGVTVGGVSIGVETSDDHKVPTVVSALLIVVGGALLIAGTAQKT